MEEVRMAVASQCLMIISPVFASVLKGEELRGRLDVVVTRTKAGLRVCHTDNSYAFGILMDICHHRTRKVPTIIGLDTMTNIATLVSKYQMFEAAEPYVRQWMYELKKSLPQSLDKSLLSWVSIAWVFKLPVEFEHLTRIAVRETSRMLVPQSLLLPDFLVGIFWKLKP